MTSRRTALRTSSIALSLVALGCQIDIGLGDLDSSSSGDDGPASSASLGGTGPAEGTDVDVAESTVADSGTTSDTSGTTSVDSGDTEVAVCEPEREELSIIVDFDPEAEPENGELVVQADCMVQGVAEDGDIRTYALECDEDGMPVPHVLEVRRSTGPIDLPLALGTPVHVQVARNYPIDTGGYRYVVVRDAAGELVLGYYSSNHLPTNLEIDVDAWFAPLEYALAFGDCEPEPYEEPGNTFIVDPCPAVETRLAVDFQLGDEGIHLLDGISGQLGPLSLYVGYARHRDPVGEDVCSRLPNRFGFVAFRER